MSDAPVVATPRPAMPLAPGGLPSRAAAAPPKPMFENILKEVKPKPKAPREAKSRPRRVPGQLTAGEVKKLNAKRARSKRVEATKVSGPAPRDVVLPPKNPNRPLEAKTKLQVVLSLTDQLRKPQLVMFAKMMEELEGVPRGSRKRILEALVRVYG